MHLSNHERQDPPSSAIILVYIGIVFVAAILTAAPLVADFVANLNKLVALR